MTICYSEAAREDVIRQFRYYLVTLDLPEVALHFKQAVRATVEAIVNHPNAGPPCRLRNPRLGNLRSWPIRGFEDIRCYYQPEGDHMLHVVRFLHGKRDVRRILEKER